MGGLEVRGVGDHDQVGDVVSSEKALSDIADMGGFVGVFHIDKEHKAGEVNADFFKDGVDGGFGDCAIDNEERVLAEGDAGVLGFGEVGDLDGGFAWDAGGLGLGDLLEGMDVFFASVATQAKDDDFEPSKRAFGGVGCDLCGRSGGGFGEMGIARVGLSLDFDQAGLEEDIHGEASVSWIAGIIFEPPNERLSAIKGAQPLAPNGRDFFLLEFLPACGIDLDAHLGFEGRGEFAEQMEPCGIEGLDLHPGGFAEVLSDDIE